MSDDEGPSEESHGPKGLRQASGSALLVKEADGVVDAACGAAGDSWGLSMPPHPCGQPSKQGRGGRVGWGCS